MYVEDELFRCKVQVRKMLWLSMVNAQVCCFQLQDMNAFEGTATTLRGECEGGTGQ